MRVADRGGRETTDLCGRLKGGGKGAMPPPDPVKISHKKDGRQRWPHRFHVSCLHLTRPLDPLLNDLGPGVRWFLKSAFLFVWSWTLFHTLLWFLGAALNLTAIYMKAAHQVEDFVYRSGTQATSHIDLKFIYIRAKAVVRHHMQPWMQILNPSAKPVMTLNFGSFNSKCEHLSDDTKI